MSERTVEDHLREEYFKLLPEITRVAEQLRTQIQYSLLPITRHLKKHENLLVKSRVKECSSAIDALRRRHEGAIFDSERPTDYSLLKLRDLAGVRVLAFPSIRVNEVDQILRSQFQTWEADPILDRETGQHLAFKYYGLCEDCSRRVRGEYQIVPMLTGLFWEVEHAALYKPSPNLKGMAASPAIQQSKSNVYHALAAFEQEFAEQLEMANRE